MFRDQNTIRPKPIGIYRPVSGKQPHGIAADLARAPTPQDSRKRLADFVQGISQAKRRGDDETVIRSMGDGGARLIYENTGPFRDPGLKNELISYYQAGAEAGGTWSDGITDAFGRGLDPALQKASYAAGAADAKAKVESGKNVGYNGNGTPRSPTPSGYDAVRQFGKNGARALAALYRDGLRPDTDLRTHTDAYIAEFLQYYEAGKEEISRQKVVFSPYGYSF